MSQSPAPFFDRVSRRSRELVDIKMSRLVVYDNNCLLFTGEAVYDANPSMILSCRVFFLPWKQYLSESTRMKTIYDRGPVTIAAILLAFFVSSISGICLPCQPSNRRYTAWDKYQGFHSPRTIYNPKVTNPTSTTVWVAGSQVVVTWYGSPFFN